MILTLVELDPDDVPPPTQTALTVSRELAAEQGESLGAIAFGAGDKAVETLARFGVEHVYRLDHPSLEEYSPELWGESVAQLLADHSPSAVVAASTDWGNEVMAQAAARSGVALATECLAVTPGPIWQLTRIRGGGVLLEDAELEAAVKLVTVAGAMREPEEAPTKTDVEIHSVSPRLDEVASTRLVEHAARSEGVGLATARVVVSGGRGVGSAEGFAPLEKLASLVGGAVGCSRVATNNGWRPHSDQVGQTGTKISPDLYIACGISGATQHWVGCMDSKAILAINIDEQAPLVTRATYAVVGDVHEVLDAVIAEVEKRTGTAAGP